jgi:dTDP-glucose pyrophosphorylase
MSYVKDGKVTYKIIPQWIDAGTFPSLEEAEKHVREHTA